MTPYSLDVERALLGGLLVHPEEIDATSARPGDLYRPDHAALLGLLLEMRSKGEVIDMVTVPERVGRSGAAVRFGGVEYVAGLADEAPPAASLEHYAGQVRRLALRRRLIEVAGQVAARAQAGAEEPEALVSEAISALAGLETQDGSDSWVHLADAAARACDEIDGRADFGRTGASTGLVSLDDRIAGLERGKLYLLAGRPGMGKSALAQGMAEAVAEAGGLVGIYSIEMDAEQLAERTLVRRADLRCQDVRHGRVSEYQRRALRREVEGLAPIPLWIDDRGTLTMRDVEQAGRRLATRGPVGLLVIDYAQILHLTGDDNRAQAVGAAANAAKRLARDLSCPIVLVAQLNRECEKRTNKRPILSDLKDSGGLEEAADCVIFLYRDGYYDERAKQDAVELIVAKQRQGPTGTIEAEWVGDTMTVRDRVQPAAPADVWEGY